MAPLNGPNDDAVRLVLCEGRYGSFYSFRVLHGLAPPYLNQL